MSCPESLRLQANFDGEADAVPVPDIERHLESCAECRALLQDLERIRSAFRSEYANVRAPMALRTRVLRAIDREGAGGVVWRARPFWWGAFSGLGAAVAATLIVFLLPSIISNQSLADDLVAAHMRSLQSARLIEVVSSDRHTVKPWFAGHADVSPVVADFTTQGYSLVGGRVDNLDRQRAAVVVYRHGAHVINVFSWRADWRPMPAETSQRGYHIVSWRVGDLQYCAVSDAGWDEMATLTVLIRHIVP